MVQDWQKDLLVVEKVDREKISRRKGANCTIHENLHLH